VNIVNVVFAPSSAFTSLWAPSLVRPVVFSCGDDCRITSWRSPVLPFTHLHTCTSSVQPSRFTIDKLYLLVSNFFAFLLKYGCGSFCFFRGFPCERATLCVLFFVFVVDSRSNDVHSRNICLCVERCIVCVDVFPSAVTPTALMCAPSWSLLCLLY
jgi:hypothetical protein